MDILKLSFRKFQVHQSLANALLDRLVLNAYRINLKGESMRKKKTDLTISK